MDLRKLEEIVKETAKGFEYELFLLRRKNLKISTENGKFEKITTAEDFGLAVRLLKNGRLGFSYTTDIEPSSVKQLVQNLMEITEILPTDDGNKFFHQKKVSKVNSPYDSEGLNLSVDEKIELVTSFEREVINSHSYIVGTRETTFSEVEYEVSFLNSFGIDFSYKGTAYSIISSALAESPNGDKNITWGYRASRFLKGLNLDNLKEELVQKLIDTLDPRPIKSRSLPVVFHREAFAALLETFAEIFSGENLIKNKTPLAEKIGETIASKKVTIIDDGTLEKGFATHPYDDEGVPQQTTILVENGILKGFYHSLYSAYKTDEKPTGNGFRNSFTSPPVANISNLYLKPEKGSFKELIENCEDVLVVYDLMGLHTADPISGEFSLGASGAIYKNGKKINAVRGITIAGNFLKLIRDIELIGEDMQFYGNVGSPSVLVKNITIGGK